MKEKATGDKGQGALIGILTCSLFLLPCSLKAQGPTTLGASSLMNAEAARGLIEKRTASHKGDTLMVKVIEVLQGSYSASVTTNKSVSATVDKVNMPLVDVFAGPILGSILGGQAGTPRKLINGLLGGGGSGAKESSTGGGSSTTDNKFATTLSVTVVDVDANGNLHIEGTKFVQVNKELQKVTLTGVVRQDDVDVNNSVTSDRIANVDIKAEGKGAVAGKTHRSLVNKILDWLF